jgi:hypothetical protein
VSERRHAETKFRIIVVQEAKDAHRWRRWLWSVEEDRRRDGWDLRKQGSAFTRWGACSKARDDIALGATSLPNIDRVEEVVTFHWSYVPTPRQSSPLAAYAPPDTEQRGE